MSMTSPVARFFSIDESTSSWKASAIVSRSSMCTVARSTRPARRMGIAPRTSGPLGLDALAREGERQLDALRETVQRVHRRDVHAELDDGPRHLRADAGENRL